VEAQAWMRWPGGSMEPWTSRGRAAIVLLTKAGIRRNERIALDHRDAGLVEQSIKPKPIPKRIEHFNNCEAPFILRLWLKIRAGMTRKGCPSLFLNAGGDRAEMSGAGRPPHDPTSQRGEDHFNPHCRRR